MKLDFRHEDGTLNGRKIAVTATVAVAAVLVFIWRQELSGALSSFVSVAKPLIYAGVIAYILWPMLRFFETRVFDRIIKKTPKARLSRILSLLVTYTVFILILVLFFSMVIPQITESVITLGEKMRAYAKTAQDWFTNIDTKNPLLAPILNSEMFAQWQTKLADYITTAVGWLYDNVQLVVTNVTSYAKTFATEAKNVLLGVVFAVYFLLFKENLFAQIKKFLKSIFADKTYDRVAHYAALTDHTFGGFINGKLIDSLIIGVLCFIFMSIFKMPFAPLISLIIGITNVIPFFGPIIGAIPSAFFILIAQPKMVFWFILMLFLLQQLDGNLIGPKILGNFIGLSPFWIIVSITIMSGLLGVFGMFFGVPTFAVFYAVIKELTEKKLAADGKPTETDAYYDDPAYEEIVKSKRREVKLPPRMLKLWEKAKDFFRIRKKK